jgi:hypothetical protein
MSATLATFQEEILLLKEVVMENMSLIFVTWATFHLDTSPLKGVRRNISCISVTLATVQDEMLPLKAAVLENMPPISVTLATVQDDTSPLNDTAFWNMAAISVILSTTQYERSPLKAKALRNIFLRVKVPVRSGASVEVKIRLEHPAK